MHMITEGDPVLEPEQEQEEHYGETTEPTNSDGTIEELLRSLLIILGGSDAD